MQAEVQVLRPKAGLRVLYVVIYLAACFLIQARLPFGIPERFRAWIVPGFIVLGGLGLANVLLTRIVLGPESMRVVSAFRSRTIQRADIASVTWAAGCGAALVLRSGRGVPLPDVTGNAQGLTNTIRAWLKRTQ